MKSHNEHLKDQLRLALPGAEGHPIPRIEPQARAEPQILGDTLKDATSLEKLEVLINAARHKCHLPPAPPRTNNKE